MRFASTQSMEHVADSCAVHFVYVYFVYVGIVYWAQL